MPGRAAGALRSFVWAFVLILSPSLLPVQCVTADNITITVSTFEGGLSAGEVAFSAPGTAVELNLSVQTGLRASSVVFNLSGASFTAGGRDYPEEPELDLGNDGDTDWRFAGTGYGALGHQTLFSDGGNYSRMAFGSGGGSNGSMAFRFPSGALPAAASVRLTPSGFSGSLNVSFDVGADDVPEWSNAALTGPATISGFESVLSSYLSTAAPSVGDAFGIRHADVPVKVRCASAATLNFSLASITYDCRLATPNLAVELNSLVPAAPGEGNVSVPVALSSGSAGRLKVLDARLELQPPTHSPETWDPQPSADTVQTEENASLDFGIRVRDIYGNPIALQWYIDAALIDGATGPNYTYSPDFNSSGSHVVSVTASNGLSEASRSWRVTVADVNRLPVVDSFFPPTSATAPVSEGQSAWFNVSAHDPDGFQVVFNWTLDGRQLSERAGSFRYQPPFGAAGMHVLEVSVVDAAGGTTRLTWQVSVRRNNLPPAFLTTSPLADPSLREGERMAFSATWTDPNNDPVQCTWTVDGAVAGEGASLNYTPDFFQSGIREVKALLSDGEYTAGKSWSVTVVDVNRPPSAVLDQPQEGAEFLDTQNLTLSARASDPDLEALAISWFDGERPLGTNATIVASLAAGPHLIRLTVEDPKGARAERSVNITVRALRYHLNVTVSPKEPKEGDAVKITVRVVSDGDATAENLTVTLHVDGVLKGTRKISRLAPGAAVTEAFEWTSSVGKHELLVTAGTSTSTASISVSHGLPSWFYPVAFLLAVLVAVLIGVTVYFTLVTKRGWVLPGFGRRAGSGSDGARLFKGGKERGTSLDTIRLDHSPYKDQPLEIGTTMPEGLSEQESIQDQLSPRPRRRFLPRPTAKPAKAREARAELPPAPTAPEALPRREVRPEAPPPARAELEAIIKEGEAPPPELPPPPPREAPGAAGEPAPPKKPKKRLKEIEDRIHAAERRGGDVTGPRRFLSLAKSFWKGGNPNKSEQYLLKAEAKLDELELTIVTSEAAAEKCPKCKSVVEAGWILCPECGTRIK